MKVQAILSDLHIPWHDPRVLGLFIETTYLYGIDEIHLLGDILDCYSVSKYTKMDTKTKAQLLTWELDQGRRLLTNIRELFPTMPIHYYEGNHEARLRRYVVEKAPALDDMLGISVREQLEASGVNLHWHSAGQPHQSGQLLLTHGSMVRAKSGMTGHAMLERYGRSVLFGHTHRGGVVHRTHQDRIISAYENFCACDLKAPYMVAPADWQQGFSLVYNDGPKGFDVHQCLVREGELRHLGNRISWSKCRYTAKKAALLRGRKS